MNNSESNGEVAQPAEPTHEPNTAAETPVAKDEQLVAPSADSKDDTAPSEPAQSDSTPTHDDNPASADSSKNQTPTVPKPKKRKLPALENVLPSWLSHRLGKAARPIAISLCGLILLAGAGGASWLYQARFLAKAKPVSRFAAVAVPFHVISTEPSDGQETVDPGTKITLRFNRPVDATKLNGDFFVSPSVAGTYAQGANADEAVFTPSTPFAPGTIVKVMLHGEFQNTDGEILGPDYFFGFTTALPDTSVNFMKDNFFETVDTAQSNQKQTFTLQLGSSVAQHTTLTTYKSTMQALLASLVYTKKQITADYSAPAPVNLTVPTTGLAQLATQPDVTDGQTFNVTEDSGVYLVTATNNGQQIGHLWVVYSNFGTLVRQDDQKAIIVAQNFSDGSDASGHVTLYNLQDGISSIGGSDLTGMTAINLPLKPQLDAAVITSGSDAAFVPMSVANSLADLRAQKDLSQTNAIFGLTDHPTYHTGDTVRFAGFIRTDNDGNYTLPTNTSLHLYAAYSRYSDHLADFTAPITGAGQFNGSFTASSTMLDNQSSLQTIHIFVDTGNQQTDNDVASFSLSSQTPSNASIQVTFSKNSYMPTDTVQATITGKTTAGTSLGGAAVHVTAYAKQYYEDSPSQNLNAFDTLGDTISDNTVTLDANGQATVTVDVSKLTAGNSHVVTVQATQVGASTAIAAGGNSATIHEGDARISFGTSKTVVAPGGTVISRMYVTKLDGTPLANATVNYTLTPSGSGTNATPLAQGTVTTDSTGFAEIHAPLPNNIQSTSVKLSVWTADENNNKVDANDFYYVQQTGTPNVFSEVQLSNLDVYGAPTNLTIGTTANLTIDAPKAMRVLLTYERGRIHHNELLDLAQGKNSYPLYITADLAPSFSLVFSYFDGGTYHTEGANYTVTPASQQDIVTLTAKPSTTGPSSTAITLAVKDSNGKPAATNAIIGITDAHAYNLSNQVVPDMFTYLYQPREITTNASSSLTIIGSGGGKCGGGGQDQPEFANPEGAVAYWNPAMDVDSSGQATLTTQLPKGTWRVYAYTMNGDSVVGSATATVTVP